MSETAETTSLNGAGPAPAPPAEVPCEDCATGGEKVLAVLAGAFAVLLLVMAFDMFTGGKVGGYVRERVPR
jgi:hypothetical protein